MRRARARSDQCRPQSVRGIRQLRRALCVHRSGARARLRGLAGEQRPGLRLAAFVAASGSAGTLAAGDYLKEKHGARIVAVEASECPTLLRNGFGEHNIQGIGDKHVPLIHNVMNTDIVVGVSDRSTGGARPPLQQRNRAVLSGGPPPYRPGTARRAEADRPVRHRQPGRRDQDRKASGARRGGRDRHRRDRQRGALRQRTPEVPGGDTTPTGSTR